MKIRMSAEVQIEGDLTDPYFMNASHHAAGMGTLVDQVRSLPEGAVIFDVGANIGLSTIAMALAKPEARIFSFEPSPSTFAHLRNNVRRFANVTPVQAAVSQARGTLRFHSAVYAAGSHVVDGGHRSDLAEAIAVDAICLDDFAEEAGVLPDFIKMDIEGHEPEALAGARRILRARRVPVFMEFNSWALNALAGHSPAAFASALWETFDIDGFQSALDLVHDNLTVKGCVSDILMRLKDDKEVPSLWDMSFSPAARAALSAAYGQPRMAAE